MTRCPAMLEATRQDGGTDEGVRMQGDEAIIESGLTVGEKVAASGSFKLRDSALVAVLPEAQVVAAAQVDR